MSIAADPDGFRGTVIRNGVPLPDEEFIDTSRRRYVPLRHAKAAVTLVFFGYTHCPDVCNVVLANIASALRRAEPGVRERAELLFITTDPKRDTPDVLRDYLDRFDRSYVGLTADLTSIRSAAASLHIAYEGEHDVRDGNYEVMHGTHVTAFVDGKSRVLWAAETSVAELRADLSKLAASA